MKVKVKKRTVPTDKKPKLYQHPQKKEEKDKDTTAAVRVKGNSVHLGRHPKPGDVVTCKKVKHPLADHIQVYLQSIPVGIISYENNQQHLHNLKAQPQWFQGVVVSFSHDDIIIELEERPKNDALKQFQRASEFVAEFAATGNKGRLMTGIIFNDGVRLVEKPNQKVTCKPFSPLYVAVFVDDTQVGYISLRPDACVFENTALSKDDINNLPDTFNGVVRQVYTAKCMQPMMLLEVNLQVENPKTNGKWNLLATYPKTFNPLANVRSVVTCTKVNYADGDIIVTINGNICGHISYKTEGNALHRDHIDSLPQQFLGVVVCMDDFMHIHVMHEFDSIVTEPEADINNPTYTALSTIVKLPIGAKLTAKKENWAGCNRFGLYHAGKQICYISDSKMISVPGTIAGEDASNLPDTFDVVVVASGTNRMGCFAYIVKPVMESNVTPQPSAKVPQAAVEEQPKKAKRYTVVAPIDTRLTLGMNLVAKKRPLVYSGGVGFDECAVFELFYGNQKMGTIAATKCMAIPGTDILPVDTAVNFPETFNVMVADSGKTESGKFAFIVEVKEEQ